MSTRSLPESARQIRFRTIGCIPVIEGKINGKKALFIMDTGASVSVLNEKKYKHFGFNSTIGNQHVVGFAGQFWLKQADNCVVQFGDLKIKSVIFRTRDLSDLTTVISQYERIEIAGIIGSDVFQQYRVRIDYNNKTISF